jgi:hypothetical protein
MRKLKMIFKVPPTSQEAVLRVEQEIGLEFPSAYREFLLSQFGGGVDGSNSCFWLPDSRSPFMVTFLFPVEGARSTISREWKTHANRMPPSLLPIGGDDFGNLFCLGLTGADRGKVYFWDHEKEMAAFELLGDVAPGNGRLGSARKSEGYWENVTLLADSFESFLNGLVGADWDPE